MLSTLLGVFVGWLDTLSEVCNALRLASTCRDEEGSVSKLAEYVSRGLARDQTIAKETDNELGIREQPPTHRRVGDWKVC